MAAPPVIPNTTSLDGTETVVIRQGGPLRRVALSVLQALMRGAQGIQGIQGEPGVAGLKGDTGPVGPNPWIDLGTVAVKETIALAVGVSVRTVRVAVPGAKKGVPVTVFPAATLPTGYGLSGAVSTLDDTVDMQITCPALALGASYNLSVRVLVARV